MPVARRPPPRRQPSPRGECRRHRKAVDNAPDDAERIACPPSKLAVLLDDEVRRGRVARDEGGGYALVAEAFTPETLAALRML